MAAIFRLSMKLGECGFGGGSYAIYHCVSYLGLARIYSRSPVTRVCTALAQD